jgi:hypothetical protein
MFSTKYLWRNVKENVILNLQLNFSDPNVTDINNSGTNALGNEWTNYKDKSYTYENYKNGDFF